jgi:hypothetical protein
VTCLRWAGAVSWLPVKTEEWVANDMVGLLKGLLKNS